MSGGITVKEFKHIPGVNDAEYIKKLEELNEINQRIINKAVAKIKMLSAQPEIIRCKDCVYQTESWSGIKYCEAHGDHIGKDYDYCSNARRKENGH